MARDQSLLSSTNPISVAPATPSIAHVQLRDLLICPRKQGLINYVADHLIIEQDLHTRGAPSRTLAKLDFTPNSLTSIQVDQDATLIAAGGQDAELHLSYHRPSTSSSPWSSLVWQDEERMSGSINNSVLLTSLNLSSSNESGVEPRVGISNNDGNVKFYDVPIRVQHSRRRLQEVGVIKLDVPVNHSSISPDARTLLSVGDSNKVYFHQISGGARLTFTPITTLIIPAPDVNPFGFSASSLVASFSTAFSRDGSKFAVASQEGVVAVWDVRATKPIKVFHSDKSRGLGGRDRPILGNGAASGWLSDDPWEWTRGKKGPGWCVRNVKFNSGDGARLGKEVMAFTEHTSVVHVVDALTFETHDIIRMPTIVRPPRHRHLRQSSAPSIVLSSQETNVSQSSSRSTLSNRWPRRDPRAPSTGNTPWTSTTNLEQMLRRPPRTRRFRGEESVPSTSSSSSSSVQPSVVQALGDAFRIPASAYSAPSSIGDSTWRTLDDEVHLGPLGGRREVGSTSRATQRNVRTTPTPSLQTLANYVLEPANRVRDNVAEEMREDEGALSRRIRREESALRRGSEFATALFEDEEDSGSDTTEYASGGPRERNGRQTRNEDGFVVVPDLGDRDVESEVHAVLAEHGIQSRLGRQRSFDFDEDRAGVSLDESGEDLATEADMDTNTGSVHGDYDYPLFRNGVNGRRRMRRWASRRGSGTNRLTAISPEVSIFDEAEEDAAVERENNLMDVDDDDDEIHPDIEEEDTDYVNSRSASPTVGSSTGISSIRNSEHKFDEDFEFGFDDTDSGAYYSGSSSSSPKPPPNVKYYDDIDLAGMCFDPSGERLYVVGSASGMSNYGDVGVGSRSEGLFSGAFGSPVTNSFFGGPDFGTVVEWGVRGAEKRFWVDEGWM